MRRGVGVIKRLYPHDRPVEAIGRAVADELGIAWTTVTGPRRSQEVVVARQAIIRAASDQGHYVTSIARVLQCDPSSVSYHLRKMKEAVL